MLPVWTQQEHELVELPVTHSTATSARRAVVASTWHRIANPEWLLTVKLDAIDTLDGKVRLVGVLHLDNGPAERHD